VGDLRRTETQQPKRAGCDGKYRPRRTIRSSYTMYILLRGNILLILLIRLMYDYYYYYYYYYDMCPTRHARRRMRKVDWESCGISM